MYGNKKIVLDPLWLFFKNLILPKVSSNTRGLEICLTQYEKLLPPRVLYHIQLLNFINSFNRICLVAA